MAAPSRKPPPSTSTRTSVATTRAGAAAARSTSAATALDLTRLLAVLVLALAGFAVLAVAYDREPLFTMDANVAEWVATSLPRGLELVARPFSWLGGWVGITALTVVAVVLLARERNWLDVAFVVMVVVGSQAAVALVKAWFDRPRPDAGSAVPLPDSAAFPSGHAASGVAVFGAFTILLAERIPSPRARACLWIGAAIVAVAVALSRIALNVHYVTDVLAGWCFGLAWLAGCLVVRDRLRGRPTR